MEDLNLTAERAVEDQEALAAEQERLRLLNLSNLANEAEGLLGTVGYEELTNNLDSELSDILGGIGTVGNNNGVGNITGSIEHDEEAEIIDTANADVLK